MKKNKYIFIYIPAFFVVEIISFVFFYENFLSSRRDYIDSKIESHRRNYQSIINSYNDISNVIFNEVVNKKEILSLLARAARVSADRRDMQRKKVYLHVRKTYANLRAINLRQLHFHLPDNTSFLRMHIPDRFGDNLTLYRSTVAAANREKKFIRGFEEGRIYNGFRYVYPMTYQGKHIGTVETSICYRAIIEKMQSNFPLYIQFLLKKDIVDKKVFPDQLKNYILSVISPSYYRENSKHIESKGKRPVEIKYLSHVNHQLAGMVQNELQLEKSFARWLSVDDEEYIVSFVSIKNYDQKHMAYFVIYEEDPTIKSYWFHYLLQFVLISLFHITIFVYILNRVRQQNILLAAKIKAEEASRQAELANAAKSEFLASMSHEIRTPMNSVLGFAEIIQEESDDADLKRYASNIICAGDTLLGLINDVLDLSRIEAGRIEIKNKPVSLARILNNISTLFYEGMESKGLDFRVEVTADIPEYYLLDELRFNQILINLIGNAKKFTREGFVHFDCNVHPGEQIDEYDFELLVQDSGVGIPLEYQEIIFDPFEQIQSDSGEYKSGTGLGLSICKRLTEMMGGRIELSSIPGQGSLFRILIPGRKAVTAPEENLATDEDYRKIQFRKATLLVVDDISINRSLVKKFLKGTPIEIYEADNGEKALEVVKKIVPDIILLDIIMPVMGGFETLEKLREDTKLHDVPVIAFTASAVYETRVELAKYFNDILIKPVSRKKLFKKLSGYLSINEIQEQSV